MSRGDAATIVGAVWLAACGGAVWFLWWVDGWRPADPPPGEGGGS